MSRRPTPKQTADRTARLGRPPDADKRLAVIDAAKQLFAVDGLQGTSMDAIARLAGVSKVTVYRYFADKDALFRESVAQACASSAPDGWDLLGGTLKHRLTRIAEDFFDLITSEQAMSLYRLMASNPRRHRKLSLLFWEAGPEAIMQRFAQLLEAAHAARELQVADSRAAAAQFFFLVKAELHMQLLIGIVDKVPPAKRRAHVDEAVAVFLRAYELRRKQS
jgi:TetR/AcrR family transcriptional repressor of mexJK operon